MSDHLKIFFDKGTTVEDILKENGGKVARGYLEGDMEFWDDGSVTRPGDENGSGYENPQKGERGQGEEDKKLG